MDYLWFFSNTTPAYSITLFPIKSQWWRWEWRKIKMITRMPTDIYWGLNMKQMTVVIPFNLTITLWSRKVYIHTSQRSNVMFKRSSIMSARPTKVEFKPSAAWLSSTNELLNIETFFDMSADIITKLEETWVKSSSFHFANIFPFMTICVLC